MERFIGRVALVTGASTGIGRAVSLRLAASKVKVVATARNMERLESLCKEAKDLDPDASIKPIQCDMRNEAEILSLFEQITNEWGGVDICINNAGLLKDSPLLSGDSDHWREMLDVNVIALSLCSREAVKSMRNRSVDDGHIINISSMGGHRVLPNASTHFYSCTKFAVTSLSEGLHQELCALNSHIRVTQISPGAVKTEFLERAQGKEAADKHYNSIKPLEANDIADSVLYALSAPPHVQIKDILMRPTEQVA